LKPKRLKLELAVTTTAIRPAALALRMERLTKPHDFRLAGAGAGHLQQVQPLQEGCNPMLVLSRKIGEKVVIGDGIVLVVKRILGQRVTFGIEAPQDVRIVRGELPRFDEAPAEKVPGANHHLSGEFTCAIRPR
jgi:carbon storage regulator